MLITTIARDYIYVKANMFRQQKYFPALPELFLAFARESKALESQYD